MSNKPGNVECIYLFDAKMFFKNEMAAQPRHPLPNDWLHCEYYYLRAEMWEEGTGLFIGASNGSPEHYSYAGRFLIIWDVDMGDRD